MDKYSKVEYNGCEVEITLKNAQNKTINNSCNESCLEKFDACFTRLEDQESEESEKEDSIQNYDLPSVSNEVLNKAQSSEKEKSQSSIIEPLQRNPLAQDDNTEVAKETSIEEHMEDLGTQEEKKDVQEEEHHVLASPNVCKEEDRVKVIEILALATEKGLLSAPLIYDEQILECYYQLVNGDLIQSILMIDGVECKFFAWRTAIGELRISDRHATKQTNYITTESRLLNDRLKDFKHLDDCGRVFSTKKYIQAIKEAKE